MLSSKTVAAAATMFALGTAQAPPFGETTVVVIDQVPAVAVRTVYATSHITVFGCPPWETNCPVRAGDTQAVVTATIAATTTICPLTFKQARLSIRQGSSPNTGGPLQTSTTRWPTLYSVPSSFASQTSWDPAIWASIFPTGAPAFTDPVTTGSFLPGEWTGTPVPLPTLDAAQAALLGISDVSSNNSGSTDDTSGPNGTAGGSAGQSVTMTTGSFAAILSSNMTAYVTTLNAYTSYFSVGAAGFTGGVSNGTGSNGTGASGTGGSGNDGLTTLWDGTVVQTGPISLQTVNDGKVVPVNLFSLLVALTALAITM